MMSRHFQRRRDKSHQKQLLSIWVLVYYILDKVIIKDVEIRQTKWCWLAFELYDILDKVIIENVEH